MPATVCQKQRVIGPVKEDLGRQLRKNNHGTYKATTVNYETHLILEQTVIYYPISTFITQINFCLCNLVLNPDFRTVPKIGRQGECIKIKRLPVKLGGLECLGLCRTDCVAINGTFRVEKHPGRADVGNDHNNEAEFMQDKKGLELAVPRNTM